METKVLEGDWVKARYEQLVFIDEKRARAQYHAQGTKKGLLKHSTNRETLKKGT